MKTPARGNLFMLLLIGFYFVVLAAITILQWLFPNMPGSEYMPVALEAAVFGLPCLCYAAMFWKKDGPLLPRRRLTVGNVLLIVLMCFAYQPVIMFISGASELFFPNLVASSLESMNGLPLMSAILIIAITPAVFEEMAFRGIILTEYGRVKTKTATLVTGLFFGIMHMNPQQFFYAFALGVVFAYFVRLTRSIYASVLAHFLTNATQIVLYYTYAGNQTDTAVSFVEKLQAVMSMGMLAFLFVPLFLLLFGFFVRYNRRRNLLIDLNGWPVTRRTDEPDGETNTPKVFNWAFWVIVCVFALVTAWEIWVLIAGGFYTRLLSI